MMDNQTLSGQTTRQFPVLLLRRHEAAGVLQIGIRLFDDLVKAGEIPAVRIGRNERFRMEDLQEWIAKRASGIRGAK